jgi:hypothetical protein
VRATRYRLRFTTGVNIPGATYGSGQYGTQTYGQQATDPLASRFYTAMPWPAGSPTTPAWMYRQGDTLPDFDCQLRSIEGPMDLTAVVDAVLVLTPFDGSLRVVFPLTKSAPAVAGRLHRVWADTDLATPGSYRATVVVVFSSTRRLTVPFDDRDLFVINSIDPSGVGP